MRINYLFAAVTLVASASRTASQVGPASNSQAEVFDPIAQGNHRVPLSEFEWKGSGDVTLTVHVEVLEWVDASDGASDDVYTNLQVALKTSSIVFRAPTDVDEVTGEVTYSGSESNASAVVVKVGLTQDLPIVTHWDSSVSRGARSLGATGGFSQSLFSQNSGHAHGTFPEIGRAHV